MTREFPPTVEVRSPPESHHGALTAPTAPAAPAALATPVATPLRGQRFGRYILLGTLGRGGMGVVVEAHDEQLDRNVAIKLLYPRAAQRYHVRLLREAQALARLSHPNVVQIYDVGMIGEQMFIAMELVRGCTLAEWRREPRAWRAVVELYLQAARGLAAAHAKDLVHRDFKPDNCILGDDGRVRVVDFGLARELSDPERTPSSVEADPASRDGSTAELSRSKRAIKRAIKQRLTRQGTVVGTLAYMSLEQLQGKTADARTDQYSFCAALHEALYDVLPYEAASPGALLAAMFEGRRATPDDSAVPRRLRSAIERGLQLLPDERWPSMDVLIGELEASSRRRRWWSAAATLGVGVALGGGMMLLRAHPDPCLPRDPTMGSVWNDDARWRLSEAFARHGRGSADPLLARITTVLDQYARDWGAMTRESCTATFTTRQQSEALFELRTRCLERRRNRVQTAIEALVTGEDAAALRQSALLPFKLPGIDACADSDALEGGAAQGEEPQYGARHEDVLRRLDKADSLREIGRLDQALALAEAARDEAATLESTRLQAEALEHVGRILADRGSLRRAKSVLQEAIVAASRARADEAAARAWLSLMFVSTTRGTVAAAEQLSLGANAAVERVDDDLLRAWLFNNHGVMASEAERWQEAQRYLERALLLKSKVLGAEHVDVGVAWFNLGMMVYSSGEHARARTALKKAQAIFEVTVGHSHLYSLIALSGLCGVEVGLRHFEEAIERCERVIALFESSPVSAVWEGRTRFRLAEALWKLERRPEARKMAQRAVRVIEPEDPAFAEMIQRWLRELDADEFSVDTVPR